MDLFYVILIYLGGKNMKDLSIKTVVAIGVGSAIFFVLGRFVAIPSGVPNTNFTIQYALLALFALLYGPVAGALIGLVGHILIDLSWGGSPWWSWVLASMCVGLVIGLLTNKINIEEQDFNKKSLMVFVIACLIANIFAWVVVAPGLDIVLYAEPSEKVFTQGFVAGLINFSASAIVGGLLAVAYSKTRVSAGSLTLDEETTETTEEVETTETEVTETKVELEKEIEVDPVD